MTDHTQWADASGAYLLRALSDEERDGYEAHLERCSACRDEVAFLRVASDALPVAVEQFAAPPELKDRIMTVVTAEASLLQAAGPAADRAATAPARRSERRWWSIVPRPALAFAATALLIAGGLGGWVLGGSDSVPQPEARTVAADVRAPGAPDARARLLVRDENATLVAKRLPRPGKNRVYQVWLKKLGTPDPVPTDALFEVRHDGSATVDVPGSLKGVEAVLVTSEPEGGSMRPTRRVIISAVPA